MAQRARMVNPQKGDAILSAAAKLFPKLGFEKTTMDAIALQAGVTKQTVYSHYKSKEQLFTCLIDNLSRAGINRTPIALETVKQFEELLHEVGLNLLKLITSIEGMAITRLVLAESNRYPRLAKLYYESGQNIVKLLAEFLDGQNARNVICIPNTQSAAAYFFALLKGQYFLRMTLGVKPVPTFKERRAHVAEVVTIFMHLYGGKNPMHTHSSL